MGDLEHGGDSRHTNLVRAIPFCANNVRFCAHPSLRLLPLFLEENEEDYENEDDYENE